MRIGDLDHLLLKLDAELFDDARYIDIREQIEDIIENEPPVNLSLNLNNITEEDILLAINEERPQVAYLCKYHKEPHYCKHTTRIEDALNFVKLEDGKYMEVDHTTESAE